MDSLPLHFRAQLGFLIAISRRSGDPEEHTNTKGVQQPGQPIPSPPNHFDRIPANAEVYPYLKREHLVRAQWAIEKLEARLNGQNPILESPADPQGDTRSKVSLSAWTAEYDGHVQEYQAYKCEWIGVKMTSPKFQAKSPDLQDQLKKVLTILNMEYLTVPNSETRLKIAVYLHNDIATLDQMKAIAALIWTMDPLLGKDVHPPHCGPNSIYSLGLQYSNLVQSSPLYLKTELKFGIATPDPWDNHLSPSRHPLGLLPHPRELKEERYTDGVRMILDADSVGELTSRLDITIEDLKRYPQASPAYKLQLSGKSDEMIIWFNQHCGTLDFTEIKHWISFCVGVIQLSIGETGISFHKSNPGLICSPVLEDCLDEIGLKELVDYHESKGITSRIPDLQYWSSGGLTFSRDSSSYMSSDGSSNLSLWEDSPFPVYEMRFAPSSSGNANYSFGIELEFYTPTKSAANSQLIDPSPEDDRQIGAQYLTDRAVQIAETITSKGRLALAEADVPSNVTPDWLSTLAKHGAVPSPGIAPVYQVWTVLPDYSLSPRKDWAGYAGVGGMEVVSPAMGDTSKDWENVVDVLRILRNNFRLLVPNSCGFHIHVAKGTQKLPLHLLRKVFALVGCAQNLIFSLCHPSRRDRSWSTPIMGKGSPSDAYYEEDWTDMDVTADFWQCIPIRTASNPRLLGTLKKVWMAPHVKKLQLLLAPTNGKCCVSLSKCQYVDDTDTEYKGTVEFRFLEGTLDPELIVSWGQLMIALVRFADIAPPEAWPPFVATVLQQPLGRCDVNVLRVFLTLLGLSDDFDFWANRVAAMSRLEADENPATPPDENRGILSRIDDSQIAALHSSLCQRERTIPCLAAKKGVIQEEPEPPVEPVDRAKLILMKAGFGGESLDKVVKNVKGGDRPTKQPGKEAREDDTDVASIHLLRVLETSRCEAENILRQHDPA